MRNLTFLLGILAAAATNIQAAPITFQSSEAQTALLELYTSEGCSSCPPAEAWLGQLKNSPVLWTNFVPMAFHVDYWNSLGWKDRWSSPEYTERQRAYADLWKSDNIYTPCFVLNGKEWNGWAFHRDVPGASGKAGVLTVSSVDANLWSAVFIPAKPLDTGYQIHAALLAGGLDSDVKAGENKGRHLRHEFAVLNLVQMELTTSNGVVRGRFIVDAPRYRSEKILALAAWVTRAGELVPLQAVGGWLNSPDGAIR
jgi:hypothetical protein